VIVVPFFISDGLHSFEDIPVLLGLSEAATAQVSNPHREGDRRLWYASAIGTEKFMADVILAQVEQARSLHPESVMAPGGEPPWVTGLKEFLRVSGAPWKIGQVLIDANFELRHEADVALPAGGLARLQTLEDLRAWLWTDAAGRFRPLRAAPNLRPGWIYAAQNVEGLVLALDYLYPAELANWQLWRGGNLPLTPWRTTAERQSGRFRVVRELDSDGIDELVAQTCRPGCLKQRLWSPASETILERPGEIPLLCPEACNFLVSQARTKLKGGVED
jgi:sirohydrochlorin cobaltochelatase